MKYLNLESIAITLISIILSFSVNSQTDTNRIWVTIENQNDVPTEINGKLYSNNTEIQQLINDYNIIHVELAVPASRRADLLKVYEVECICERNQLNAQIEEIKGMTDPVRAPEYELLVTPNDYSTIFAQDYALDLINAQEAWDYTQGDSNVILGISDGSFYLNHEELENEYVSANLSTYAPAPYLHHGTAVATIAAGETNNGIGKSSIGFDCKMALANMGYNNLLNLSYGGAKVINASWAGGCWFHPYYQTIIDEVYDNGSIIVAAAGNGGTCGGPTNLVYPAALNHVISISSIGPNDNHERTIGNPGTTHQHNDSVDLCAPGYDVALTAAPNWYLTGNGSSFAAPYVTGTIGLMLSMRPCLTFEEVLSILQITSSDLDSLNPNYSGLLGAGRLDAGKALEYLASYPMLSASINPGTAAICANQTTSISVIPNAGFPPYTYNWTTSAAPYIMGSNNQSIDATAPGEYIVTVVDSTGCSMTNDTIVITDYSNGITVNAGPDQSICAELTNTIQLNGSSPVTGASIWSGFQGIMTSANDTLAIYTPSSTEIANGSVQLTLTSENNQGCASSTDTITIDLNTFDSQINADIENVLCFQGNDGAINLTVSNQYTNYNYNWSNGMTTEDISGLDEGLYNVTITDSSGCIDSASFLITQPNELIIDSYSFSNYSGFNTTCSNSNDASIDITINGGSFPYSYNWTSNNGLNIATTEDISNIVADTYSVIVTDNNGCNTSENFSLIAPSPIQISETILSYNSGDNISCFGESDGEIQLNITGGVSAYNVNWTTQNGSGILSNNEDQTGLTAGNYYVEVSDTYGCISNAEYSLTQPSLLQLDMVANTFPSGDNISCFSSSDGSIEVTVTGGSSAYQYDWQGSNTIQNLEDQTGLSAGNYSLEVTDANGCVITDQLDLIEPSELTVQIDILTDFYGKAVSCSSNNDGEVKATAFGGSPSYSYSWSGISNQSTAIATNLGEGMYNITIFDLNGCFTSDHVQLEANPSPVPNPTDHISACQGNIIEFSATPEDNETSSWALSNGMMLDHSGPHALLFPETGCIDALLTVTNDYQCTTAIELQDYICIRENPKADFSSSTHEITFIQNQVEFQNYSLNATEYDWSFGDGTWDSEIEPNHYYDSETPGEFLVTLFAYNEFGCVDSMSRVISQVEELLFYVPNTFTPDGNEYNNDFKPVFGSGYSAEDYSLEVYNRWGEIVFMTQNMSFGWDGTTPNGDIAMNGTYVWKMTLKSDITSTGQGKKQVYHGQVNILR